MITKERAVTGSYPTCEICGNSLRRPCTIAWEDEEHIAHGKIACASCYRVWMALAFMASEGLIKNEQ